jgi:hypothetical protein
MDNFNWSNMIGYGNTGSYISHVCQKMHVASGHFIFSPFYTPISRRAVLCDCVRRAAGGRPHKFPHDNFSSLYRTFTKLGHMIPLWKGKNPIYFGVIMSKVKVTVTINIIVDSRIVSAR